jgi:predicted hotdog family 3-hydroxylacyl-ACP dehydratase
LIADKTQIAELIPHGPGMSLIDRVIECDAEHIVCATDSHGSESNPLLSNGKLASIVLVEYASQAAAIHAALNQHEFTQGKPAYIGSIKNVTLHADSINHIAETLLLESLCLLANPNGAVYEFNIKYQSPAPSVSSPALQTTDAKRAEKFQIEQKVAEGQLNLIIPQ